MKNSTKQVSSNKKPKEVKPLVKTLGGLLFYPPAKQKGRADIFYSISDWLDAKKPDDVYIHDSLEALQTANIAIVDAVCHRGIYTKTLVKPKRSCVVNRIGLKNLVKRVEPSASKTVKGISVSDTKEHHTMIY